jgi:hypothetical protein
MFTAIEDYFPDVVDIYWAQNLNHKLGTKGLNLKGIGAEAAKRNLTIMDLFAMPEQDGWVYSG